jgi:TonB-dependent SusC/RagA subfamily outer membrane receptor
MNQEESMKKVLFFFLFLAVIPIMVNAQGTFKVKGKVTDSKTGEPLIGANIVLKPLNLGAPSDFNGNYSFDVPESAANGQNAELIASYVNYKKKVFKVQLDGSNITHNFELEEDVFQNEEVVVTGIASKTAKEIAEISVSRIPAKELTESNTYGSLNQLLSGKVSGVQMSTASGNVGSGYRFYVRGGGGLNGNEQPIIYIDGVKANNTMVEGYAVGGQDISLLSDLNPNDIESIEVLKGPAAAATYGTSGSNGVVLIKTKKGSFAPGTGSAISVNYRFNYGFNERSLKYRAEDVVTVDAANEIFKRGLIYDHFVSVAGGTPSLRYYGSYQNRNENGIVNNNSNIKNGLRLNLTAVPTDKITLSLSSSYVDNMVSRPVNDNSILGYLGNVLLMGTPYRFTKKEAIDAQTDVHKINQFIGSFQASYAIIDGMEANATIGVDQMNWNQEQQSPYGFKYGGDIYGTRSLYSIAQRVMTYDLNLKYTYSIVPDLNVTSMIGSQANDDIAKITFISVNKFATGKILDIGGGVDVVGKGESSSNKRQAGIFTEHQFNYLNTYMLSLAIRKDYASALNKSDASVTYPKASAAIRIDRLIGLPNFINSFKIRGSYGENGQLPGSLDAIALTWTSFNSGYGPSSRINSVGNPDLEPERIKEIEFGFDTELFGDVSLEFTYYHQNASGSIIDRPLAPSTGYGAFSQPYNVGSLKSWGFESLLQYHPIRTADYDLNISLIWNYQNSEVTSLGGEAPIYDQWNINVYKEGLRKHEFYYWKTTGALFDPTTHEYIGPAMTEERESLGNPYPDHSGSLAINFKFLKNFNLYALGEWGLNNKVFSNTLYFMAQFGGYKPLNDLYDKLATQTPGTADYISTANEIAKLDPVNQGNFIYNAEYFALREVSLGYDFTDLLKDYSLDTYFKHLSIGISARNVWRTSAYKLSDFEVNSTGGSGGGVVSAALTRGNEFLTLQNPRTVNFWINVGF